MKNSIKRKMLYTLANAPTIAGEKLVKELATDEEKKEAIRLLKAVGVKIKTEDTKK